MRFTAIRVRKLVSGPGFNHAAVEAEVSVEGYDDPERTREKLTQWVDVQLGRMRERDVLIEDVMALRRECVGLQQRRDAYQKDITAARTVIKEHDKLRELAHANGIDALNEEIQF